MSEANSPQIEYWNGRAGEKWAQLKDRLDTMLWHVTDALKARVAVRPGQRVLDIGCGTGETCTIWHAHGADVTGVDVSVPMLEVAAQRTQGQVTLIQADASVWQSPEPFDLAVSRFGVMFFDSPHTAFARIAANLRPGGRLVFACWRTAAENHWVGTPMNAIQDLLPESPPPVPHAPGPFALADKDRLAGILEQAGFVEIAIQPLDLPVSLAHTGGVDEAVHFALQVGPSGAALAAVDQLTRDLAAERLREALAPHDRDGQVALPGAIWLVEAVRPV